MIPQSRAVMQLLATLKPCSDAVCNAGLRQFVE